MTAWLERPREEAHLLNPAFCCVGITAAAISYQKEAQRNLPFPLAHMVLPIVLHKRTRDELPRGSSTSLPMWIQDHASVRLLFFERLIALRSHTREALLFGCQRGWLRIGGDATLHAEIHVAAFRRAIQPLDDEPKACILKALFVGRWFARAGPAPTVMALWGIQL